MKRLEVYTNTPWGQITNANHEKNLRIVWKAYGEFYRHVKNQGYPHPRIEQELKACRMILSSSEPKHNSFQFLKHRYLSMRLNRDLSAIEIIDNLKEMGEWRD